MEWLCLKGWLENKTETSNGSKCRYHLRFNIKKEAVTLVEEESRHKNLEESRYKNLEESIISCKILQQWDPGSERKFEIMRYVKATHADKHHANGSNPESIIFTAVYQLIYQQKQKQEGYFVKPNWGWQKDLNAPEDTLPSLPTCNCQSVHCIIIQLSLQNFPREDILISRVLNLHLKGGKIQPRYFLNPLVALSCTLRAHDGMLSPASGNKMLSGNVTVGSLNL